jgi:D-glycero-alpha-D-manno-heptose-7-phosphate kinase
MKTRVRLQPDRPLGISVSSRGFKTEVQPAENPSFTGPLGLIFATAAYFRIDGVRIEILSESPPRSALGGSSTAAVALIGALEKVLADDGTGMRSRREMALLGHAIEESVAGIPCGIQDQLAAAYGGVNAWYWPQSVADPPFERKAVIREEDYGSLEKVLLLAYCGVPHESKDINRKWIGQFLEGHVRPRWAEIVASTRAFIAAVSKKDWTGAVDAINREVEIRRALTPEVFDEIGNALHDAALSCNCGARFAGAGGGGCIWALGEEEGIRALRPKWVEILSRREGAKLLDARIDPKGLEVT